MGKKITQTFGCRLAIAALILLSAILIHDSEALATSTKLSSGFGWKYAYDKQGRIASITNPANKKTRFRYMQNKKGGLNGMTKELPDGSKVKFKFDKYGRRTEMVDSAGTVSYVYDKIGHLTKVHRKGTPAITYGYDTLDRIKSIKIGTGFNVQYAYDFRGRPKKITTPVGNIIFSYNTKTGEVTRRLPNGILTKWTERPDGLLKSITHTSAGGRSLAKYHYNYRLDGLITSIKELTSSGVQTSRYKYDTAQRLASTSGADQPKIEFAYDKSGNRTKLVRQGHNPVSARYDWAGRLTRYNGKQIQHDPAGNLTSCSGSSKSFTFDDTGLLKTATLKNGNINYRYDGDGYLISRRQGTRKQDFVPDPLSDIWQPLVIKGSDGQQTFYIWDGTRPLMAITGKLERYFLHDHLGSGRLVTDQRGEIIERFNYTPFGQPEKKPTEWDLKPGFAGLFFDKAASVYLTRARVYDPELGHFLQPDPEHRVPFGSQKDMSVYAYCGGDPVNFVDITGLKWENLSGTLPGMKRQLHGNNAARRQDQGWDISKMRWQQSQRMAKMRWQQDKMRWRQSQMMSKMRRQQDKMRWRQSKMQQQQMMRSQQSTSFSNIRYKQNRMREDASRRLESSLALGASYNKFRNEYFQLYPMTVAASALHVGRLIIAPIGGLRFSAIRGLGQGGSSILESKMAAISPGVAQVFRQRERGVKSLEGFLSYGRLGKAGVEVIRSKPGLIREVWTSKPHLRGQQYEFFKNKLIIDGEKFNPIFKWGRNKLVGMGVRHSVSALGGGGVSVHQTSSSFSYQETFSGAAFNKKYREDEDKWYPGSSPGGPGGGGPNRYSGLGQSPVGGIRLTGAGNALSHLGGLEGIALDKTNDRLILIGKGDRPINLPPLRLDDVVTIFRCVYQHGAAPSVTIDPISDKDTEKWMNVIHGEGTKNTYVGWILYEADRIMKNYGLGKDNKTKKKIYSPIPGYRDFNAIGAVSGKRRWERFWIVPASMKRTQGTTSELTMFDVPLKLMTEKMEWDGTKLVTAKNPTPSKGATAYTKWFTSQYNKIAKEVKLLPPKHFGFEKPVAIYEELRRIALISGIAETLRDQNVPFPAWMYDYPVKTCISDSQTPRIKVTGKGYGKKYTVYGGVQLSPSVKNIKTVKEDVQVTQLAKIVQRKIAGKPLFAPVKFQQKGKTYTAVTLPGADTQRSGANMFSYNDLPVEVLQEAGIQLTRHFNSFYDPRGLFGRGWTLDLPRLRSQKQPTNRTERSVTYKTVYQLSSPLNSWSERFANYEVVSEPGRQLMVPSKPGEMLGLADANLRVIGYQTKELLFRNGESLHFDKDGYLVGQLEGKAFIVYERNKNHTISSVKSFAVKDRRVAEHPQAELLLTYKANDRRVFSIEAKKSPILKDSLKAIYIYDEHGQLSRVIGPNGTSQYTYKDGLVTSVTDKDNNRVAFEYNKQGQLQKEKGADGKKVAYKRISTSYGSKVVAMDANSKEAVETVEYDANFYLRGSSRMFDDGSKFAWRQHDKEMETTTTQPDGEGYTVTDSNDGRQSSLKSTAGETYTTDYDADGRVIKEHLEGGPTLEQKWHADGRLKSVVSDEQGVQPRYTGDGKLSSVIVTPPDQMQTKQPAEYFKTNYDAKGRVASVTDDSGSKLEIRYDKSGQPSEISSQRGTVTIDRDTKGQVREVGTTWGLSEKYDYDEKSGSLSRITLQQHDGAATEQATIELTDGLVSKVLQPDGGETTLNYYRDEKKKGLLKEVQTTEKLKLAYSYDKSTRLTGIDIGGSNDTAYRVSYDYDKKGRLAGLSYKPISGR